MEEREKRRGKAGEYEEGGPLRFFEPDTRPDPEAQEEHRHNLGVDAERVSEDGVCEKEKERDEGRLSLAREALENQEDEKRGETHEKDHGHPCPAVTRDREPRKDHQLQEHGVPGHVPPAPP